MKETEFEENSPFYRVVLKVDDTSYETRGHIDKLGRAYVPFRPSWEQASEIVITDLDAPEAAISAQVIKTERRYKGDICTTLVIYF